MSNQYDPAFLSDNNFGFIRVKQAFDLLQTSVRPVKGSCCTARAKKNKKGACAALYPETKLQEDKAEVCYQALMLWYGCLSVSECVSHLISTPRCKRAWPYHSAAASSCLLLHPILPLCCWDHQYKHTHTAKQSRSEETLQNSSIHPSLMFSERTGFLPVCGDVPRQQILIKHWMSIWWKEWEGPHIDPWSRIACGFETFSRAG